MNKHLTILFATCMLIAAPFVAAESKKDNFETMLTKMSPEEKIPLAKLLVAQADAEIQTSLASHKNIEKARITYEPNNSIKYTIHMRHDKKLSEILNDNDSKKLFGQFMGNAFKKYICSGNQKELKGLSLVGIENLQIDIHHDEQPFIQSAFNITECL